MANRAARTCMEDSAGLENSAGDGRAVFCFKGCQARIEQLAAGHNHDVEARRDVISTENLSNQTLSTISDDRSAQPLRRGNTKATEGESIRLCEQRVVAARNSAAMLVDVLEIGVSADPLARAELQTLFAADGKTLTAFRAAPLQDQAAVFRAHAHQEPVRALAAAGIWLECALALHSFLRGPRLRVCELAIVAKGFRQCQSRRVRIDMPLC